MTNRNNRSRSDRTGSSRGSVRLRQRLFAFTALSMALVMALAGMGALPGAEAYVSVDGGIPISAGDIPKVKTSLTHTPPKLEKGASGTYSGSVTVDFPASAANTTYTAEIYVRQDQDAPFAPVPSLDSFTISGLAVGKKQLTKVNDNTWKLSLEGIKVSGQSQLNINFSARFTVSDKVLPGQSLSASLSAKVRPSANIALINPQPSVVKWNSDGCSGTLEMKGEVATRDSAGNPTTGGWLVDVKFADPNGKRDAQLDPLVLNSDNFKITPPGSTSALSGGAFDKFIGGSEFRSPDATKPIFGIAPPLTNRSVFLDSLNFPYDPTTFSGKTAWLEPGTTIAVKRTFRLRNCALHFATDFDPTRDIAGVQFQIARPLLEASDQAVDSFNIPGSQPGPPNWCEAVYFSFRNTDQPPILGNDYNIGVSVFDPLAAPPTMNVVMQQRPARAGYELGRTLRGGIAVSEKFTDTVFSLARPYPLIRRQSIIATKITLNSSSGESKVVHELPESWNTVDNISFDNQGWLWSLRDTQNNSNGSIGIDRYLINDNLTVTNFQRPANRIALPSNDWEIRDLLFLNDGSMLTMRHNTNTGQLRAEIYPRALLGTGDIITPESPGVEVWGVYQTDAGMTTNAFAFGPDGKLYGSMSKTGMTSNEIYEFPRGASSQSAPVKIDYAGTKNYYSDAASCSYGSRTATPPVKVAKAPVDPVTGIIGEYGSASKNKVTFKADGMATIQYVIAVTNTTDKETESVKVEDTLTLPLGFSLNGPITYSQIGVEAGVQGSSVSPTFEFNSGLIPAKASNYFLVTVKLTGTKEAISSDANAACYMETGGGSGFFNHTEIEGDRDEPDNNACIPREPTKIGHLVLKKQLYEYRGNTPIKLSDDEAIKHFELVATRLPNSIGSSVEPSGVSGVPSSQSNGLGTAFDGDVSPGTYQLGENFVNKAPEGQWEPYSNWECSGGKSFHAAKGEVQIEAGNNVTCVVSNIRRPNFKIEKFATYPASASPGDNSSSFEHFGQRVNLDAYTGQGVLSYDIVVTNLSGFAGDTNKIFDTFYPPAGIKIDANKQATITNLKTNVSKSISFTSAQPTQPIADFLSLQAAGQAGSSVRLRITIPIIAAENFQEHKESLEACTADSADKKYVDIVKGTGGVVNNTSLLDEHVPAEDSAGNWYKDNFACIPVTLEPIFHVKKVAKDPQLTENPHIGDGIDFKLGAQIEFKYRIEVVNDSVITADAPEVKDLFKLPNGLVGYTDGQIAPLVTVEFDPNGTRATRSSGESEYYQKAFFAPGGVILADKIDNIPAKSSVYFDITVPLMPDLRRDAEGITEYTKYAEALGQCGVKSTEFGKYADASSPKGVINTVSLAEEVQEGIADKTDDNAACIPVIPPDAVSAPPLPLTGGLAKLQVLIIGLIVTAIGGAWASFDLIRRRRSTV